MNQELKVSLDILNKVYFDKAYASIELNRALLANNFNKAAVTKIVYGVLEQDIYLDYVVHHFIKNEPKPNVLLILKLGTYVLKNINSIPPYTVNNELVEITKNEVDRFVAGFVNATLKSIANKDVELPDKNKNLSKYLSVKYSYPEWIISQLLKTHNAQFVEKIISYNLTTLTHIRLLKNVSSSEFISNLETNGIEYHTTIDNSCMYVDYAKLKNVEYFNNLYVVMGLPSIITARNVLALPNSKILDVCSAPGGKACLIAESEQSLTVTACDIHIHRIGLVKNYANTLHLNNVKTLILDGTKYESNFVNAFDCVLVDAPCSGLGVVSKKPDILLNRTLNDVLTLSGLQQKLLNNVCNYVKPNGTLVYSTCSILKQENENVVDAFLKAHKEFVVEDINVFGLDVTKNANGSYTFYPQNTNSEGFFIARFKKI